MGREIKFRAWGIWEGEMSLWEEYRYDICDKISADKTKAILMQYAGLKDKNDKEIYEGDIVKVNGELMEVFFKDGYFGWGKEHSGAYSFDPFGAEQLEVIGNIYENPDLLSKLKED